MKSSRPSGEQRHRFVWVDWSGKAQPIEAPPGSYFGPTLSPDGTRIAFTLVAGRNQVWTYDLARGTSTRAAAGRNHQPVWTPDGLRLAFASGAPGNENVFWRSADGSGTAERLTAGNRPQLPRSWSPDGRTLAFVQHDPQTDWDIWTLSLDGSGARPLIQTPFIEEFPRFSPDGRWLAYQSNETGRSQVYVRPHPSASSRWPISADGGAFPVWSRDGRHLFFHSEGGGLWVAAVNTEGEFAAGKPRLLFTREDRRARFDVAADAKRFLIVDFDPMWYSTHMGLVIGWARGLAPATGR